MEKVHHLQQLLLRSRRLPWILLLLVLATLGGAIALSTWETRRRIRDQISGRDGRMFHELARMHQAADAELGDPADPASQLTILLEISRLKSVVMAARLFDAQARFIVAVPPDVTETNLAAAELEVLQHLEPVSHFHPAARLADQFLGHADQVPGRALPVLVVNVPLHQGGSLVGIAQFILDGASIDGEFARLDRTLLGQAMAAFAVGSVILALAIGWAFRRLNDAHRLLAERTGHLVRANQELALAAKTSAVGAVTSHLIHGLKNPLAGLQNFVAGLGANLADHPNPGTDLGQAIAATRRMQTMINDVLAVLREEEEAGHFEMSLPELVDMISNKVQPLCRERGVTFESQLVAQAVLPARATNLIALVLVNLVQNAIEATPRGRAVELKLTDTGDAIDCAVRDQGPGFPAARPVFAPCRSAKDGGSGIGLAISKQLAHHLGAGLELKSNTTLGCTFVLTLPASLWKDKTRSVTVTLG